MLYLTHLHYCNSQSGDNSYVYLNDKHVSFTNLLSLVEDCVTNCDDTDKSMITDYISSFFNLKEPNYSKDINGRQVMGTMEGEMYQISISSPGGEDVYHGTYQPVTFTATSSL